MNQDYQITASTQEITAIFIKKKCLNEDDHPQSIREKNVAPSSEKAQNRAQYQFPAPAAESGSIICEYERVIKIYNKHHSDTRKKFTKTIEHWFLDEAKRCGWADAKFYKCDGSNKKACLLVRQADSESSNVSKH